MLCMLRGIVDSKSTLHVWNLSHVCRIRRTAFWRYEINNRKESEMRSILSTNMIKLRVPICVRQSITDPARLRFNAYAISVLTIIRSARHKRLTVINGNSRTVLFFLPSFSLFFFCFLLIQYGFL